MQKNDLIISEPIKYAENGVSQCWTCKNCVGRKEFWGKTFSGDRMRFWLPECRVADMYMTYTSIIPCSKYEVMKGGKMDGKND